MKQSDNNKYEAVNASASANETSQVSSQSKPSSSSKIKREDKRTIAAAIKKTAKEARKKIYPNGVDILAIIGIILGSLLIAGIVGALLMKMNQSGVINGFSTALIYFIQFALAIGFVVLQRRVRGAKVNIIHFMSGKLSAPLILWGFLLMTVTGIVIEPILNLFPAEYLNSIYKLVSTGGWAILTTVVLAPIMEETLFRGLIQGSISTKYGPTAGILISALIFGLIHGIPQQVVNAFFIGIILGYIYYRTNSLLTVIILHFLNNGIALLQLELFGEDIVSTSTRSMIGNENLYYVVYGISLALMIVGAIAIIRNLHLQDKQSKKLKELENTASIE